jgi:hypothetical protein
MNFRVRIQAERIFFDSAEMKPEVRRMAQHTSRAMKRRIKRSKSASNAGQDPHGKSGTLRRSIGIKQVKGDGVGFWVGAREGGPRNRDGFYGRFLQHSTKNMAARPFVDRTIEAERPTVERGLTGAAERSLKVKK